MKSFRHILLICALAAIPLPVQAQARRKAPEDSIVHLVKAAKAQMITEFGIEYRRVTGNAEFLHNKTTLLCDSASWNLGENVIEAYGNVKLKQKGTTLTSEQLTYFVDDDLAEFRGDIVELVDKDGNRLRTRYLDYNTRDSVAVFNDGGSVKDSHGNVIESIVGTYDSKISTFTFEDDVKVYMDSIFMSSNKMLYLADSSKAVFGPGTMTWMNDGFARSDGGWYNEKDSILCYRDNVYCKDKDNESWSDETYYFRKERIVEMYRNVKVLDSANNIVLLGNKLRYEQDSSLAFLLEDPAVVQFGKDEGGKVDTVFLRADSLIFRGIQKCRLPEDVVGEADRRHKDILFDALQELRNKQAEERQKKLEEGLRAAGKLPPLDSAATAAAADSAANADSLPVAASPSDSLQVNAPPPDTTEIKILTALHNFKLYRSDMQAVCDSVSFTTIDSIAVLTGRPVMWSDSTTQLTSEVMHLLVKDGGLHRGSMLYDARLVQQETEQFYNQIKSTEMMGFFRKNKLYRFDALGSVTAIIYMKDSDDKLTNVNVKESKSLTAMIKNNKAQRMLYLEEIKSDAYPVLQLPMDRHLLKGFEWRGDERPRSRYEITTMSLPRSMRAAYAFVRRPVFELTDEYFDGYMSEVYRNIREREEAERLRRNEEKRVSDSLRVADSLSMVEVASATDSVSAADSLAAAKPVTDTVSAVKASADTAKVSLSRREARREARLKKRQERIEARKARAEARAARRKQRAEAKAARKAATEAKASDPAAAPVQAPVPAAKPTTTPPSRHGGRQLDKPFLKAGRHGSNPVSKP